MKICPNCNTKINKGNFCPTCGKQLDENNVLIEKPSAGKFIVIGIIILLVAALSIFLVLRRSRRIPVDLVETTEASGIASTENDNINTSDSTKPASIKADENEENDYKNKIPSNEAITTEASGLNESCINAYKERINSHLEEFESNDENADNQYCWIQYTLYDITGNGTPELFVYDNGDKHGGILYVYNYNNDDCELMDEIDTELSYGEPLYIYENGFIWENEYKGEVIILYYQWMGDHFREKEIYEEYNENWRDEEEWDTVSLSDYFDMNRVHETLPFTDLEDYSIFTDYVNNDAGSDDNNYQVKLENNKNQPNLDQRMEEVFEKVRETDGDMEDYSEYEMGEDGYSLWDGDELKMIVAFFEDEAPSTRYYFFDDDELIFAEYGDGDEDEISQIFMDDGKIFRIVYYDIDGEEHVMDDPEEWEDLQESINEEAATYYYKAFESYVFNE